MKKLEQDNMAEIENLKSKIQALENENRLLRERLNEAGISYADILPEGNDKSAEGYDPDQGARIKRFEVTDKVANAFFMMFCRGRKDVYELRYTNPRTGKNGYYTQCLTAGTETAIYRKKTEYDARTVRLGRISLLHYP